MEQGDVLIHPPMDDENNFSHTVPDSDNLENCSMNESVQQFVDESNLILNSIHNIKERFHLDKNDIDELSSEFENKNFKACDNNEDIVDTTVNGNTTCSENLTEQMNEDCIIEYDSKNDQHQETDVNLKVEENTPLIYDWAGPKLICRSRDEFKPTATNEMFTKGCFWSPDEDPASPDFKSVLRVKEGGLIYDTCWYPFMNSWDPATCCFLSASQGSPVHLWDAFTGQLRATYRAYNLVDEVEAANSVQFTESGTKVWTGFKNALRTFETDRPGRQIKVHLNYFLIKGAKSTLLG